MAIRAFFDPVLNKYGLFEPAVTGPGLFDKDLTFLPQHLFPFINQTSVFTSSADATSHDVDIPVVSRKGSLLILTVLTSGTPTITWPAGWTAMTGLPTSNTNVRMDSRYRISDMTEGTTVTITLSVSNSLVGIGYEILGHDSTAHPPELGTSATAASAKPDPPNLRPVGNGVLHRATVAGSGAWTTGGTITIPASIRTGDLLLVSVVNAGASGINVTCTDNDTGGNTWTRWTAASSSPDESSTFYKLATKNTLSKTITIAGGATSTAAVFSAYSGVDPFNPVTDPTKEFNSGADETQVGFTPSFADEMICFAVLNVEGANTVTSPACTNPGALTKRGEHLSSGGAGSAVMHASLIQTGGPTATGNFTWSQADAATHSVAFGLKPANSSVDFLWIVLEGNNGTTAPLNYPSGYDSTRAQTATPLGGTATDLATIWRKRFAASEDPLLFDISASANWIAQTLAVFPGIEGLDDFNAIHKRDYPDQAWWFHFTWDASFWTSQASPPRAAGSAPATQNEISRREYPREPWWWTEVRVEASGWLQAPLAKSNATARAKDEYPRHHWWFEAKRDIFSETWTASPRPGNRQARQGSVEFPRDVWWWLAQFDAMHLGTSYSPRPANVISDLSITVHKREYPKDAWWWEYGRVLSNDLELRWPPPKNRVAQNGQRIRTFPEDEWWFRHILPPDVELRFPPIKNRQNQAGQKIRSLPEEEWWPRTPLESGFTFFPVKVTSAPAPKLPRPEYPIDPWWFERPPTIPSQQGQIREPQPSHCCTFGAPILYTASNWGVGVQFYYEVYMRAVVGTAHSRLYNRTDNSPVAGSELITTSPSYVRLRTGPITLADGREYISQFCVTGADSLAAKSARLVVI